MTKNIIKHISVLLIIALVLASTSLTTVLLYQKEIFTKKTLLSEQEKHEETRDNLISSDEINYQKKTPNGYKGFFEEIRTIDNDLFYIAHPIATTLDNPPEIIIYNHGQLATITTDFETYPMNNIREYANIFANNNYIFIAANQYGDTWGDDSAIEANIRAIDWIKENYNTSEKVNVIGFSMGGRSAMNQALRDSDSISSIALLAPGTGFLDWNTKDFEELNMIPTKLWQGTEDVNIFPSHNIDFIFKASQNDWIVEFELVENQSHYDMDTEMMNEILEFFEEEGKVL